MMKRQLWLLGAVASFPSMSGCMTCMSSSCLGDETYQRLMHPKPYIEYWEKAEGSDSERKRDSTECGGGDSDYAPSFSTKKIQAAKRAGETDDETRTRLEAEWRNCMGMKGYRFTRSY